MKQRKRTGREGDAPARFWGRHAVLAAIANPARRVRRIWGVRETLSAIDLPPVLPIQYCSPADLARLVPRDTPHQGIIAEVDPLEDIWLGDILEKHAHSRRPIVVLDQLTDPHNVGAIFRSAAAFEAVAVVTQDRHSPAETGALAKAASGALEITPWVRVVNLARALDDIAAHEYWRIGLSGQAGQALADSFGGARTALVLGAEGAGLRPNIAEHCDLLARLPISPAMESLNVSNAAAIALYAAASRAGEAEEG